MSEIDEICRLCGAESLKLIAVLDFDENEATLEPNLLQKIRYCLPVEINDYDAFPKKVCEDCCCKAHMFYEFIETILTTQKMLTDKLDNIKIIKTNKSKVVSKLSPLIAGMSDKVAALSNLSVQKVSGNDNIPYTDSLVKHCINTKSEVIQVLERLQKSATMVTISKIKKEPVEIIRTEPIKVEQVDSISELVNNDDEIGEALLSDDEDDEDKNDNNCSDELDDINEEYIDDTMTVDDDPSDDYKPSDISSPICSPKFSISSSTNKFVQKSQKSQKVVVLKMKSPAAYVCMTCKQKFPSFEPLKEHMKNSDLCKQIHLTCDTCGKVCDTKKALYQHSLTHKEKNTFVCDECGKTYSNRFNLENHKSSFHGEQVEEYGSIYKCKVCDDQFTNRKELYAHINAHAKTPSVHLCDTCGKCFNSLETLRSHIRIHLDIRPFPCTYCEKRFRSRLQLTQHLHVHTGVKPFNCVSCGKAFAKKGSLVAHVRIHTGELPYECNMCLEKFASSSKLKTHSKVHPKNAEVLC